MSVKKPNFLPTPTHCDVCKVKLTTYFVDGATVLGMWATMCARCHVQVGKGLGTGKGQSYEKDASGNWFKTGG